MKIVVSLGGSLLTSDFSSTNIKKYVDAIKEISGKGHRTIVVVGGGKIAREYINIAHDFDVSDFKKDFVAIKLTHANAALFASALGDCAEHEIKYAHDAIVEQFDTTNKIIVCGGTVPGQSTDGVSSELASAIDADIVVNATNVAGVYDSDPKINQDAKKLDKLSHEEFSKIIGENEQAPGKYGLFDIKAVHVLKKKNIKLVIIDGSNPEELIRAINGEHSGSLIHSIL
ncbi:MAG: UMP kinase [Candidatus Aenigmarchaeota archaeon]|nr:UMP kinase [Candidatus Aenigmarchaeota archaeon]MCK5373154.1 UMP kinase [Candidatus Aenigmarchaeota archaeon]MCK5452162.1 UMP kinase [Candidatus Aenigmarchaeota archaeon]